jgi:EmrB/QacA subfamily drug resistance transporter
MVDTAAAELGTADDPPALGKAARNIAFALIIGGMLLAALDSTIMATALPTIVGDLGGGDHMTWVVTAYLLTETIATVLAGKFGDLFGRKTIFILSIIVFVVASALAGAAQNMGWLIAMRAVQGIGGGGLTVTATAMIADIIPLRDRGKYQGALGAVFGVTTVLGPLLGGLFTDHLSWRWVFYINVPIAAIILVLSFRLLPATKAADRPVIDYLGIAFVSAGSGALILATSWGGTQFAWGSPTIIGLFVAAVVLLAAFVAVELRASDPVLPMRLFRGSVFSISSTLSFIVGFALLGAMTFLPTYLQYCQGVSATVSGVRTFPMVIGLLIASISAGNVVSTTGKYKQFPIAGAVVMGVGLFLLSRLDAHSSTLVTSVAMFVLGVGIGLAMQVLTIIVQNTADYRDLGVATSGVTFFRTMGSSFGSSVFGAIYANQLASHLGQAIASSGADPKLVTTPDGVKRLPPAQHATIVGAYSDTLQTVFSYAIPVAGVALLVALFLKQVPLRGLTQSGAADVGHGFGIPDQRSSQEQLEGQIVRLLRTEFPAAAPRLLREAGSGMDAVQMWIVRQVAIYQHQAEDRVADPVLIAGRKRMPVGVIQPAIDDGVQAGLIDEVEGGLMLSDDGWTAFRTVVRAIAGWVRQQIERENGAPLTDAELEQLRHIARRLALHEEEQVSDPVAAVRSLAAETP